MVVDYGFAVRNDNLAVPRNGYHQHIRQLFLDLIHGQTAEAAVPFHFELDQRNLPCGKDAVGQGVLLNQIFVDFIGDRHVRIDDMIDVHCFLDEIQLVHMLRIPHSGDHLATSKFLRKTCDHDVFFVAFRYGQQKIKSSDFVFLQQTDLLGIPVNGHDIQLLGDLIQLVLIFIKYGN